MRIGASRVGLLVGLVVLLGAAPGASAQVYEPNDSFITGFGPVMAGTTYSAGTETDNDEDYYFFYVPQRTQMFFNLTGTKTVSGGICAYVYQQTHSDYPYIDNSELYVHQGEAQTASVTLDRGKYYLVVADGCANAGETYTFAISPPGSTSTYEPFAAACAAAHVPVIAASQQVASAKAKLAKAKRRLAKARARRASRARIRLLKARVTTAKAALRGANAGFRSAVAAEGSACAVPQ